MIHRYIRQFFRSFTRNRAQRMLTLLGLVMGITAVLLAYVVIQDEQSFDAFHSQQDRIYRVNKNLVESSGERSKNAETPGLMAPTLEADFPEVARATHLAPWFDQVLLSHETKSTFVKGWLFADSNFFRVFDFELIRGEDPAKILSTPGQIMLTPQLARALFGTADPIGKIVKGLQDQDFVVAALVAPAPRQSHIQYEAIVSWASTESQAKLLNFSFMNNWLGQTVYTYLLLNQPEQAAAVNAKLADFTARYMENRKDVYSFYLQPLDEVYLHSADLLYLRGGKYGSAPFLDTFSWIALLILLIACFNYINITTAQSLHRAKEVGVKKVLGAARRQLVGQFMTETLGMCLIAGLIGLLLAQFCLPWLNQWFNKDIPAEALHSLPSYGFLLGLIGITGVIAGLFPSWLLSKFRPISVLRNSTKLSPGGEWPRQLLTALQLTISIGLIAATIMQYRQFDFMLNKDLGFDKEQVMVMNTPPGIADNHQLAKQELAALPGISSVSICNASVGDGTFGTTIIPEGHEEELMVELFRVDTHYVKTFGMELAQGRFLGLASDWEPGAMVVNEALVKQMGWDNPLDRRIRFEAEGESYPIVGVLQDFHFTSLHQAVSPLVMYLDTRTTHTSIRLDPGQMVSLMPQIQAIWEKFEPRYPFDYYFMDEFFAEQYMAEQQMLRVITLFSILAIFIACMGLYGLASFAIARRRKEIGIRKVLGASVLSIVALLSSRLVKLVALALLVATPLVYYFTQNWLQEFAYQVNHSYWVFALAGMIVLAIVLATVSVQSVQAARANPINSLKAE